MAVWKFNGFLKILFSIENQLKILFCKYYVQSNGIVFTFFGNTHWHHIDLIQQYEMLLGISISIAVNYNLSIFLAHSVYLNLNFLTHFRNWLIKITHEFVFAWVGRKISQWTSKWRRLTCCFCHSVESDICRNNFFCSSTGIFHLRFYRHIERNKRH